MAKRRDINIFDKSRKIKETGRLSDMDYLDSFEESRPSKKEIKPEENTVTKSVAVEKKEWVRHTFIIKPENLEELKDIVHTVKSTGNYQYSQKQALDDAIKLLKEVTENKIGGKLKKFKG